MTATVQRSTRRGRVAGSDLIEAHDEGERVGYLEYTAVSPEFYGEDSGSLTVYDVWVAESHRRQGVASSMLRVAMEGLGPRPLVRPATPLSVDGQGWWDATRGIRSTASGRVRIHRGVELTGPQLWGVEAEHADAFEDLMRSGRHREAAEYVLDLMAQGAPRTLEQGQQYGVWWSTDPEVARGYMGDFKRRLNVLGEPEEATLGIALHGWVDHEGVSWGEAEQFGYSAEAPVILRPGARVDLDAVDLSWTDSDRQDPMRMSEVHRVQLSRTVTARTRLNEWPPAEPDDPDWASVLRRIPRVYRGYGVNDPELHRVLFASDADEYDKATAVLDAVSQRGLGIHWSAHRGEAAGFAGMAADRGGVRVIVTAIPPDPGEVLTGEERRGLGIQTFHESLGEQEIPVRPGTDLSIVQIEWAPGGPRPMLRDDDGGGWEGTVARTVRTAEVSRKVRSQTLYRGIRKIELGRRQAEFWQAVIDGNVQPFVMSLLGTQVRTDSAGKSWTTDLDTARRFATGRAVGSGELSTNAIALVLVGRVDDSELMEDPTQIPGYRMNNWEEFEVPVRSGGRVQVTAVEVGYAGDSPHRRLDHATMDPYNPDWSKSMMGTDDIRWERLSISMAVTAMRWDDPGYRLRLWSQGGVVAEHQVGPIALRAWHPEPDLWDILAMVDGEVVGDLTVFSGTGEFSHLIPEGKASPGGVEVHPGYRRQGVASAMLAFAEQVTGLTMIPSPEGNSPDAQAFWGHPNRTFGSAAGQLPDGLQIETREFHDPFVPGSGPIRWGDDTFTYFINDEAGREVSSLKLRQRLSDGVYEVWQVWTHPDHRRQGLARSLLERARADLGRVDHSPREHRSQDGLAWSRSVSPHSAARMREFPGGIVGEGDQMRWEGPHDELLREALYEMKGSKSQMHIHLDDEVWGAPQPGSGSGKRTRAYARALLTELRTAARPNPVPLYRGGTLNDLVNSWSESRQVAERFAQRYGTDVQVLPAGQGRGLKVADYIHSGLDDIESEWLVLAPNARLASRTARSGMVTLWRGLYFGGIDDHEEAAAIRANPTRYVDVNTSRAGIHWTDDPNSAYNFALGKDPEGWYVHEIEGVGTYGVVIEAAVSQEHTVDPHSDDWDDFAFGSAVLDYRIEREVTVYPGSPINPARAALVMVVDGREEEVPLSIAMPRTATTRREPQHEPFGPVADDAFLFHL